MSPSTIGIVNGTPFAPDARMKILPEAPRSPLRTIAGAAKLR
jgi:hypothetical protein